jgi:serine/threonine protein kinase
MKAGFEPRPANDAPDGKSGAALPTIARLAELFSQLEITEFVGRGGMGAVYKARQTRLKRFVALKILLPAKQDDPQFVERFEREAGALASLNHPNIVTVHDFGQTQGLYYLLMEFVPGSTLRQVLMQRRLTPAEALTLVPQICQALQYAHERGIVHRDIKPENILIDTGNQVKISDFGIAKLLEPEPDRIYLTSAQNVVGTPHYMAPEQIENPKLVDHRADIYSLGVVFYEMLTGELPIGKFQAPSQKVQVDVRLDEVVLHALEREPDRRYQNVSHVKTDLETIATAPGRKPPFTPPRQQPVGTKTWSWKKAAVTRVLGFIALALLVGLIALLLRASRQHPPVPPKVWWHCGRARTMPVTASERTTASS